MTLNTTRYVSTQFKDIEQLAVTSWNATSYHIQNVARSTHCN